MKLLLLMLFNNLFAPQASAIPPLDHYIWTVSRLLSAAICLTVAAIAIFICYMIVRQKRRS